MKRLIWCLNEHMMNVQMCKRKEPKTERFRPNFYLFCVRRINDQKTQRSFVVRDALSLICSVLWLKIMFCIRSWSRSGWTLARCDGIRSHYSLEHIGRGKYIRKIICNKTRNRKNRKRKEKSTIQSAVSTQSACVVQLSTFVIFFSPEQFMTWNELSRLSSALLCTHERMKNK